MGDDEQAVRDALAVDRAVRRTLQRWRQGPPIAQGRLAHQEAAVEDVRRRRQADLDSGQPDDVRDNALRALEVLSPWNLPPTKREVMTTLQAVKAARSAVHTAINKLTKLEQTGAWYGARSISMPGLEELGHPCDRVADPRLDPLPPLLLASEVLEAYVARLEPMVAADERARRSETLIAEDLLTPVLQMEDVSMAEAAAVMRSRGVSKSRAAVISAGRRVRQAKVPIPPRRLGNKRK